MDDRDDQKNGRKTPPNREGETLRYGTPEPSELAGLELHDPTLKPLTERYTLLAELGRGGMGIVYKARDRETDEVVALKVLRPEISRRADLIERFKSEMRLARKITHKNVCRVHDLNRFGDLVAISMEYIEGESLRSVLNRAGTLSVPHGARILRQVLAGLAEAHAEGVVHRDLKPENIIEAKDGTVKVMDFGIARSLEPDARQTGTLIGTPAYMSPEQAEGQPIDARSDIYALGLVLYEMFTGQPAFEGKTPVAVMIKQVSKPPVPPRRLEPAIPPHIETTILKCLEKDPGKRFQSVAELAVALEEEPGTGWNFSRRRIALGAGVALIVLLLVGGFTFFPALFGAGGGEPAPALTPADEPASNLTPSSPAASPATMAFLHMKSEHKFREGTLSVWADDKLAYRTELTADVKRWFFFLKRVEGSLAKTVRLPAGEHTIRVRVQSPADNYDQSASTRAEFVPEKLKTLEISFGKDKQLSLAWLQ